MSNKFCINLNLNINPLDTDILYQDLCRNPAGSEFEFAQQTAGIPTTVLNPDLVALLDNLNLHVIWIDTFYNYSYQTSKIHTDAVVGDCVKMNFVYGGTDSLMLWYKTDIVKPVEFNKGTGYVPYREDEVTLLHLQQVGFPSIIQAGVPHNIKNFAEPRFCLSLFLVSKHPDHAVTMDQPANINYLLEHYLDHVVTIDQADQLFNNLKLGAG